MGICTYRMLIILLLQFMNYIITRKRYAILSIIFHFIIDSHFMLLIQVVYIVYENLLRILLLYANVVRQTLHAIFLESTLHAVTHPRS